MAKLIELPNGVWVDPGAVTSIKTHRGHIILGFPAANVDIPPRVDIGVGEMCQFTRLEFSDFDAAKDWAVAFGKQVNESR